MCVEKSSDNELIKQLDIQLKNPEYHTWNNNSISHTYYCIINPNEEIHNKANELLSGYIRWLKGYTFGLWEYFVRYESCGSLLPPINHISHQMELCNQHYNAQKNGEKSNLENIPFNVKRDTVIKNSRLSLFRDNYFIWDYSSE